MDAMDKRRFFPLDRQALSKEPFMQQAARELIALAKKNGSRTLDMSQFVCVVPASRAKRTLTAYLVDFVEKEIKGENPAFDADWIPPDVLLLGETPEKLYEPAKIYGTPLQIANDITRTYCESRALRTFLTDPRYSFDANVLFPAPKDQAKARHAALVADPKDALKLAQTFLNLDQSLANELKNSRDVAKECSKQGFVNEARRWEAVGKLRELYLKEIQRCNRFDRNDARKKAIDSRQIGGSDYDLANGVPRRYFVIGAVDLNRQQKKFFDALGERVQFWVYAPVAPPKEKKTDFDVEFETSYSKFFDEYGCVLPERWSLEPDVAPKLTLPIPDENVFLVDSPEDQGKAVALLTRELSAKFKNKKPSSADDYDPISAESLTIGAPDLEVVPFVEERMKEIGYATIHGEGTPVVQNRVFRVIELFARYLETRSFDVFGELLRRPDVELWFRRVWDRYELPVASEEKTPDSEEARQRELDDALAADEDAASAEEAESGGDLPNATTVDAQNHVRLIEEFDEYRARFLPTRVGGRWFKVIDENDRNNNRYFLQLRKAAHIIDEALAPFFGEKNAPRLYNTLASRDKRDSFDAEKGDVDALKIDQNITGRLLVDRVAYSTRQQKRPLAEWAEPIMTLVDAVYPSDVVRPDFDEESQIEGFSKLFRNALDDLYRAPSKDVNGNALEDVEVTGAFAIRILLNEIRGKSVAPTPNQQVVEIQGWLDLLFDDAPACVLTGFNERVVPSTISGDLFLPNDTRKALGLSDASRIFARDAYIAHTLACSRDAFFVVLEKRTLQKDPRIPSRFLFAVDDDDVPARVVRYFGDDALKNFKDLERRHMNAAGNEFIPFRPTATEETAKNASTPSSAQTSADLTRPPVLTLPDNSPYSWPKPRNDEKSSDAFAMNVTDFEKFLHSPYRYFLEKARRLVPAPSASNELDAAEFGTLAHEVLSEFGRDESVKDSTNERQIYSWLSKRLDEHAAKATNDYTSPFVRVQIENLRARLRSFAAWQAKWRESGYRIIEFEQNYNVDVKELRLGQTTDSRIAATKIVGRVDRVDYNENERRFFVFDYKTFDDAKSGSKKEIESPISHSSGAFLLTSRLGSTLDQKHRRNVRDGESNCPSSFSQTYPNEDLDAIFKKRWFNLQLPLYRHFLAPKAAEKNAAIFLGYIVLTPTKVHALGAPWTSDELRGADYMCRWVVEQIWRICDKGLVDPRETLDGFLPVLDGAKQKYDDFAPITLSYLDAN